MLKSKALVGCVGGLAAGFAMRLLVVAWQARHDGDPAHGPFGLDAEADRNGAWLLAPSLNAIEAERFGALLHYGLSTVAGGAYPFLPHWMQRAKGMPYGLLIWFFGDLVAVSISQVSDPRTKTVDSHAIAIGAHVLYSAVLDTVTKQITRIDYYQS